MSHKTGSNKHESYRKKRFDALYQKHLTNLKLQGKSKTTIDLYSRPLRRLAQYFDRCPDTLTTDDLKTYFADLVESHSWSTVKTDRNGIQFFYRYVLNRHWQFIDIVKPPSVKRLPDILNPDELSRLLNACRRLEIRAFILTTYSMGLRLSETLNLSVNDIDANKMRVHLRQCKGRKDRYVPLPSQTLITLRNHWKTHRNPRWLFPQGKTVQAQHEAEKPMNRSLPQRAMRKLVRECGINKEVSLHSLRHSFATHLLELGLSLRAIQDILGHMRPETTALYTRLTKVVEINSHRIINQLVDGLPIEGNNHDPR